MEDNVRLETAATATAKALLDEPESDSGGHGLSTVEKNRAAPPIMMAWRVPCSRQQSPVLVSEQLNVHMQGIMACRRQQRRLNLSPA